MINSYYRCLPSLLFSSSLFSTSFCLLFFLFFCRPSSSFLSPYVPYSSPSFSSLFCFAFLQVSYLYFPLMVTPAGGAEVTDDESEDEEDDVESDAATAGSSLSESRERALSVALHPLRVPSPLIPTRPSVAPALNRPTVSSVPVLPSSSSSSSAAAAPVALPLFPPVSAGFAPSAASAFAQPSDGEASDVTSSRNDRDVMPPPAPTANAAGERQPFNRAIYEGVECFLYLWEDGTFILSQFH